MHKSFLKYKRELIHLSVYVLVIFSQCIIFNWLCVHSILLSSLFSYPNNFLAYYFPKLSVAFFFASVAIIVKNKIFDTLSVILITLWMYVEIVYFRAYEMFVPATSMLIVNNLDGFIESVIIYVRSEDLLILAMPALYFIFLCRFNIDYVRPIRLFFLSFAFSIILNFCGLYYRYNLIKPMGCYISHVNPIANATIRPYGGATCRDFVLDFSPIHHLFRNFYELYLYFLDIKPYVYLSDDELGILSESVRFNSETLQPSSSLLILLIESLEGWTITDETTPFLYGLSKDAHCLYVRNVKSQQRAGMSSDGQLIVMTGLLPLKESIAVFDYPFNTYPSLSDIYNTVGLRTVGIFPTPLSCWNQIYMNDAYHIQKGLSCNGDYNVISSTYDELFSSEFILSVTVSTHTPFTAYSDSSSLKLPDNMPNIMRDYLKSVNYIDKKIEWLFHMMRKNNLLDNFTIVITGDHTILPYDVRNNCNHYSIDNGLSYRVEDKACPLIIYSPKQERNKNIDVDAYQMDIFPTILYAIDCDNYYWRGFGKNLYKFDDDKDNCLRGNVSEYENLSDKIIKMNYFSRQ